jgi:prepilin-type N-terminal cleavage/methylation domain-containing protein
MKNKGFTLVELLVTVSIISLLSVVVFANYRLGEKRFALERSAHKLAQDIRRAQNMSMTTQEFQGAVPGGYGIYFNITNPTQYFLFADLNGNKIYDSNEKVQTLEFEKRVSIIILSPSSPLNIFFFPPDPAVLISGNPAINSASITLNFEGGSGKTIKVNKVGLIEIE